MKKVCGLVLIVVTTILLFGCSSTDSKKTSEINEYPTSILDLVPTSSIEATETTQKTPDVIPTDVPTPTPVPYPEVGDIIKLGKYEQDFDFDNGKEEIEWIVIAKDETEALVLSRYVLFYGEFQSGLAKPWENSAMRERLSIFYEQSFSSVEKEVVSRSSITATKNPKYNVSPGKDTIDDVFLLSIDEVNEYLVSEEIRKCVPTEYAKEYCWSAYTSDTSMLNGKATCWWWLRTPGKKDTSIATVSDDGSVYYEGAGKGNYSGGVRPAMRILLDAYIEMTYSPATPVPEATLILEPTSTPEMTPSPIDGLEIGDVIRFGYYEQDNNESNGKEPIEWTIIAKEDNKVLMISKYALDCLPYDNSSLSVSTWQTCSLRKWLNGTFLDSSFSEEEKEIIVKTKVTADRNPSYGSFTTSGSDTNDKVFLLSSKEATKYFSSDYERICAGTPYCLAKGAYLVNGGVWWWLRTPGYDSSRASGVSEKGFIDDSGYDVDRTDNVIRPAMWISLG